MFRVNITKNRAITTERELLTHGQVGAKVQFTFSNDWADLKKTAVFKCCGKAIDVLEEQWETNYTVVIPPEMTQDIGTMVRVGVYGRNDSGKRVTPTVYTNLSLVAEAADPSGDTSTDQSLPVYSQLQIELDEVKNNLKNTAAKAVQVVPQNFSDDEKLQARENIGADGYPYGYHEIKAGRPSNPSTILYRAWANFDIIEPPADASSDLLKAWLFIAFTGGGEAITISWPKSRFKQS